MGSNVSDVQVCLAGKSASHLRAVILEAVRGFVLSGLFIETQITQALIRCAALNHMTQLGMPQSYKVGA
jgi:hypothetical protein